jgi:hypothetical protein
MRPYSTIRPRKPTKEDPYCVIPIPPKSVVRLARAYRNTPRGRRDLGRVFRVGYYGQLDGLDCVWLVNESGEYEQTTDHDCLFKHFEIIVTSDEKSLYGRKRPKLPAVRKP